MIRRPFAVRSRLVRAAAVAALAVVAGLSAATTASAHSSLERTDPVDGAQVAALPTAITLTFNQNVLGLGTLLEVTGPGGNVADGAASVTDNTVTQPVQPGAPAGAYTVLWRVTSADGHPISGRFAFDVTTGTAASGDGGTAPTDPPAASAASPDDSGTASGSGTNSAVVWLLVALGALVVAAGIYLAARRSGPTRADDEVEAEETDAGQPLP